MALTRVQYLRLSTWVGIKFWAADCLTVGYGYVALAFAGMLILQRTGGVRDQTN